jgi:hypothetical protein
VSDKKKVQCGKEKEPRIEIVDEVHRLRNLEKKHETGSPSPKTETVVLPRFPVREVEEA